MDQTIQSLFQFIKNSPSCFHAAMSMAKQLEAAGYHELKEYDSWTLQPGGRYYMERNQSSIVAFQLPMQEATHFQITASHSDSPSFKLKPKAEMDVYGTYIKLNVEGYGSMLCSTWFDRPLAIAGRAVIKTEQGIVSRLIHIDEDLVLIPNVAIHMNRNANSNISYNIQNDLLPLYAMKQEDDVMDVIAAAAGCDKTAVINTELFLYNRQQGSVWGAHKEFISAPQLDDLECAFTALQGFLQAKAEHSAVNIFCCFDNEEVGSGTKQGADSTMLHDVLARIADGMGMEAGKLPQMIARSIMLSADNAHSLHPNHSELHDPSNPIFMNRGIVIKHSARQSYTTDALSAAVFKALCEKVNVPVQEFVNRSDIPGGGTLGSISASHVSILSCDIGLAQLAMHSAYETAGVQDVQDMIKVMRCFYETNIDLRGDAIKLG